MSDSRHVKALGSTTFMRDKGGDSVQFPVDARRVWNIFHPKLALLVFCRSLIGRTAAIEVFLPVNYTVVQ